MKNIEKSVKINRGATAIARTSLSKPTKYFLKKGIFNKNVSVLDYGCGKGYDVEFLKNEGFDIKGYEPFASDKFLEKPTEKFDIVVNNYVLNVVEIPEERKKIVDELKKLGKKVYISVRADKKSIKPTWKKFGDGFITPKGTFQKIYNEETLREEFGNDIKILVSDSIGITFEI